MFWSPNQYCSGCGPSSLDPWYPGDNYVDIVGIDWYPKNGYTTFADVYGPFYNYYAKGHNKVRRPPNSSVLVLSKNPY